MPWLETDPMDQRTAFITDHQRALYSMTDLCARYGVSRRTGYKWLTRFAEGGRRGLRDQSRAPHHCPNRIDAALAELLCTTRRKHPDWGAGKLLDYLEPRHPGTAWARGQHRQ
jgi:transposase